MKKSTGLLDDSEDDSSTSSASRIALAEEGERRAIALAGAITAAVKAGDADLALRFAQELVEALGGVRNALAIA